MIELTTLDGLKTYINVSHIFQVKDVGETSGAVIVMSDTIDFSVKESYADVKAAIVAANA